MSTPVGRLKFVKLSIVVDVGSLISIILLCVLISNCSREFLFTKVDLLTVNFSIFVGKGIGPETNAPVLSAVSIISLQQSSITL